MKKSLLVLFLVGVMTFSVIASDCIGGEKITTTQTTSSPSPTETTTPSPMTTTSTPSETTTTPPSPSETSPTKTGICGPALIIGLALLPVLLGKRK